MEFDTSCFLPSCTKRKFLLMYQKICVGIDCKEKPKYEITYDSGTHDQNLILCQKHYDIPIFQLNIKNKKELKE